MNQLNPSQMEGLPCSVFLEFCSHLSQIKDFQHLTLVSKQFNEWTEKIITDGSYQSKLVEQIEPLMKCKFHESPDKFFGYACCQNNSIMVKLLLNDNRVNPAYSNNFGFRWACRNKCLETIKVLFKDSTDQVDPTVANGSAIKWAIECGNIDIIKFLLRDRLVSYCDNIFAMISSGPIIIKSMRECLEVLLNNPYFDPSSDENYALRYACRNGYTQWVTLLLADPRVDPFDHHNDAINGASLYGYIDIVKLLLDHQSNYDNHNEAIIIACQRGYIDIIRLLLNDRNNRNNKVNIDLFESSINHQGKIICDNNRAIFIASEKGYTDIVKLLLDDRISNGYDYSNKDDEAVIRYSEERATSHIKISMGDHFESSMDGSFESVDSDQ